MIRYKPEQSGALRGACCHHAQGLHYCEEVLLDCAEHYGLCRPPASHVSLAEVRRS